jgi:hypothetical protein
MVPSPLNRARHTTYSLPKYSASHSILDTWWHMLSWGVSSQDSVLSRFEHDKPHHLVESNRLHPSILAQTIASILTMVKSHLDGWENISHKDTSQTQHHKGWKNLYDTHDCMAKHN